MNSLNILHINDALKVQKEQDIKIDLVCFTGDLIQRGDKALDDEKQMEIAEDILVNPVLNSLGLEKNKFIIVQRQYDIYDQSFCTSL